MDAARSKFPRQAIALLMQRHAQQVPAAGEGWILSEKPAAKLLGLLDAAGAVLGDGGSIERFGFVHGSCRL